jgi:hypothetical protein
MRLAEPQLVAAVTCWPDWCGLWRIRSQTHVAEGQHGEMQGIVSMSAELPGVLRLAGLLLREMSSTAGWPWHVLRATRIDMQMPCIHVYYTGAANTEWVNTPSSWLLVPRPVHYLLQHSNG